MQCNIEEIILNYYKSFLFIYYYFFFKAIDIPVGDAEPGKQLEIKGHCCDDGK